MTPESMVTESENDAEANHSAVLASRRRRFFAFIIDSLLLGIVGGAILYQFTEQIIELGWMARLIGLGIGIVYFGLLESNIMGGQSIGKKAMGIVVRSRDGSCLSPALAALRYCILMLPPLCNHVSPNPDAIGMFLLGLATVGLFGVGGLHAYLFLFNRSTKQSIHDLATGAFVLRDGESSGSLPQLAALHKYVSIAWAAVFIAALGVTSLGAEMIWSPELRAKGAQEIEFYLSTRELIQKETGAKLVSLVAGTSTYSSIGERPRSVNYHSAKLVVSKPPEDYDALAARIVPILLEHMPETPETDLLRVNLNYGANVLIASFNTSRTVSHSIEEWKALSAH